MRRRDFLSAAASAAAVGVPSRDGSQQEPDVTDGLLSVKAFGAVGDGQADDTAAVQAAIDAGAAGIVFFPPGTYLVGGLRLPSDVRLVGTSVGYTYLRVKPGFSGTVIADTGNATRIQLEQLVLDCNAQASGNGIELGVAELRANREHNYLAWLRGVRVLGCPGTAFHIRSNVSELVDVWASYGNGTGMHLEGTAVRAHRIACEGSKERELLLRCTDAHISGLHIETPVTDAPILVDARGAVLDGVTLSVDRQTAISDVIRLSPQSAGCEVRGLRINIGQDGADYVNLLRDEAAGVTISKHELPDPHWLGFYLQPGMPSYWREVAGPTRFGGSVSFTPVALPDGDATPNVGAGVMFKLGNTRDTTITDFLGAVEGQEITLVLDGRSTIASGQAIRLRGGRSFKGQRGDTLTLIRVDARWYEKSRTAD